MKILFALLVLLIGASCTTLPDSGKSTIGYLDLGATKVNHASNYGGNVGPAARVGVMYQLTDSKAGKEPCDQNRMVGLVSDISLGYQHETFDAGFDSNLASLCLGLRYYIDTKTRTAQPYIGVGVLPQMVQACPDVGHPETAFALGGYAQVGVDFPLGDRSRLGIQYRTTFASNFTLGDQRVNFNGGTLSAEFGWGF